MIQAKTLSDVVNAIEKRYPIYSRINGKDHEVNPILLLQQTMIVVINQIKNGSLYIDYEC